MRKEFTVGEDHISGGKPRDEARCPVAMAAREAFRTNNVWVRCDEITIGPNGAGIRPGHYPMPYDLFMFVADFDMGLAVSPGTFTLRVAPN